MSKTIKFCLEDFDAEAVLADPESLVLPKRLDYAISVLVKILNAVKDNNTCQRWAAAQRAVEVARQQDCKIADSALPTLHRIRPVTLTVAEVTTLSNAFDQVCWNGLPLDEFFHATALGLLAKLREKIAEQLS